MKFTEIHLPVKTAKYIRYFCTLLIIMLMVGTAEHLNEKEIIFPEMAALAIGMWMVNKRVWKVSKTGLLLLMTSGACMGICLVRYSPFPLFINLALAFLFAAFCLIITRSTLIPLISACMLPVLLHTESWVYPITVFCLSLFIISGQSLMEKLKLRTPVPYIPAHTNRKKEISKWLKIWCIFLILASIPVYTSYSYCILPPLIVTYVEFAHSKAGFRNRPVQIFTLLVSGALLGTFFQWLGHLYFHLPESVVACILFICLFTIFEYTGKFFAPVGAVALIPMIIPSDTLFWFPLQVSLGAFFFITSAMLIFLKCYKWPKAHLIVSLIPSFIRHSRRK